MPVHLPPLSRRDFLVRSAASAAGLLLGGCMLGGSRKAEPHTWALLSDSHIAGDRAKMARGINMAQQLAAVVKDVLAQPRLPAGVFVNGDLAYNSGLAEDYALFTELVKPLREAGLPLHLAMGNHDHREHFWAALRSDAAAKRPVADRVVAIVPTARANWFMLDSLDRTNSTPGKFDQTQLTWLARALDAHADKPALVIAHHNPSFDPTKVSIIDQAAFFDVLRPRRQVKAFFFGHSHRWSVTEDQSGLHLVNLPTTAYRFDTAQPVGWVTAQLEPKGARLTLRAIDPQHKAHGQVVDLAWRA